MKCVLAWLSLCVLCEASASSAVKGFLRELRRQSRPNGDEAREQSGTGNLGDSVATKTAGMDSSWRGGISLPPSAAEKSARRRKPPCYCSQRPAVEILPIFLPKPPKSFSLVRKAEVTIGT